MFSRVFTGSALLIPMLLSTEPASAQRVSADIRIGGGPIAGHIRIRPDRSRYRDHYRDYRPRIVRVEVLRARDFYRRPKWLRDFRRDARFGVIYYDRFADRYFDRSRPGLIMIQVFQRGDRYYRWDDSRFDRWMRDRWRDDRWEDRFDDRFDDRYDRNGRYGERGDDRYRNDDRYDDRRDRRGDPRGGGDGR